MEGRMKVVFVKFTPNAKKLYMFECPVKGFYVSEGDTVIVPNANGEETEATVVDVEIFDFDYSTNEDELQRLLWVAGTELPLRRAIAKIDREDCKYDE